MVEASSSFIYSPIRKINQIISTDVQIAIDVIDGRIENYGIKMKVIKNSCCLRFLLVFVAFCFLQGGSPLWAQKGARKKPVKILGINLDTLLQPPIKAIDTSYIIPYYNFLHIHPVLEDRNYSLLVTDDQRGISYKPNITFSVGGGLAYKWFGFDFTFKVPFTDKALGRKGKTQQLGLGFSYTGRKILFNTYFQSAKGMYLSNPEEFDIQWFLNNSSFPIRKDILVRTLYTKAYYNFNYKKFSNPASFSFQERQKKSAGTFLLGGSFISFQLRADSTLIPFADEGTIPMDDRKVKFNSYGITLNPGYAHTFVFKEIFFASVFVRPGVALKMTKNFDTSENDIPYKLKLGWNGDVLGTIGINNDRYYGGVTYSLLVFSDKLKDTGIFNSYSYLRVLIGRRFNFNPGGFLRKIPGFNNKR